MVGLFLLILCYPALGCCPAPLYLCNLWMSLAILLYLQSIHCEHWPGFTLAVVWRFVLKITRMIAVTFGVGGEPLLPSSFLAAGRLDFMAIVVASI